MSKIGLVKTVFALGMGGFIGYTSYPIFLDKLNYKKEKAKTQDISVEEVDPSLDE